MARTNFLILLMWFTCLQTQAQAIASTAESSPQSVIEQMKAEFSARFTGEAGNVGNVQLPKSPDQDLRSMKYPYYYWPPNGCSTSAVTNYNQNLKPDEEYSKNVSKLGDFVDFTEACNHHDICYETPGAEHVQCNASFTFELTESCRKLAIDTNDSLEETFWKIVDPRTPAKVPPCLEAAKGVSQAVVTGAFFRLAFFGSQELALKAQEYARSIANEQLAWLSNDLTRLQSLPESQSNPVLQKESERINREIVATQKTINQLEGDITRQKDHLSRIKNRP